MGNNVEHINIPYLWYWYLFLLLEFLYFMVAKVDQMLSKTRTIMRTLPKLLFLCPPLEKSSTWGLNPTTYTGIFFILLFLCTDLRKVKQLPVKLRTLRHLNFMLLFLYILAILKFNHR